MGREEEGGVNGHRLIRLPGNFRMEGFWRVESVCDNKGVEPVFMRCREPLLFCRFS